MTAAQKKNHAAVVSLKWRYKGRNVTGVALHGFSDYYGQNTAGYRINGIELSLGGGAKTLNGIALGFGTLSTYGAVNGIIVHSLFTSVGHLRGVSGPAVSAEYDTLDGIALFSFFALHYQFQGVSVAGFWQTGGIGNGISVSGIGHQYDDAFRGVAACGVVGIYDGLFRGITVSGIGNKFSGNASGLAFSGIYNYASQGFSGVSISLLRNKSGGQFNGLQTGIFCRAEKLAGVQVGLINRSNRVSGVQFGLINIIHSNPKGRRVLPFVNWCFREMKDTVVAAHTNGLTHIKTYYKNGMLQDEYFLKGGKKHGTQKHWTSMGTLDHSQEWKDGVREGEEHSIAEYFIPESIFWRADTVYYIKKQTPYYSSYTSSASLEVSENYVNGDIVHYVVSNGDTFNYSRNTIKSGVFIHDIWEVGVLGLLYQNDSVVSCGFQPEGFFRQKIDFIDPVKDTLNIFCKSGIIFSGKHYYSIELLLSIINDINSSLGNAGPTNIHIVANSNNNYFRWDMYYKRTGPGDYKYIENSLFDICLTTRKKITRMLLRNDTLTLYYSSGKKLAEFHYSKPIVWPLYYYSPEEFGSAFEFTEDGRLVRAITPDSVCYYNHSGGHSVKIYSDRILVYDSLVKPRFIASSAQRFLLNNAGDTICFREGDTLFSWSSPGKISTVAILLPGDSITVKKDGSYIFNGLRTVFIANELSQSRGFAFTSASGQTNESQNLYFWLFANYTDLKNTLSLFAYPEDSVLRHPENSSTWLDYRVTY
ncbi:MAG: toxin-antitoxin system YwqK family antitoxin [Bacteroidota bacterium]